MKVLHVSDLHIGKRVNGMSMLDDQRYILRQILDIAEKRQVSVLLIAGDIYDKASPSAEAVTAYLTGLEKRFQISEVRDAARAHLKELHSGGRK